MSSLLKEAIIDAQALKEAALKNAESTIIDKYSEEVKQMVENILTATPDPDWHGSVSITIHADDGNDGGTAALGLSSAYGYQIKGTEFREKPVGYTTYVGIGTGKWFTSVDGTPPNAGVANTCYYVTFDDVTQYTGISTGSVVKLVGHQSTPNLSSYELNSIDITV